MRGLPLICFVALPFVTGCNLTKLITFNVVNEPINTADKHGVAHRAEKLAKDAWDQHQVELPDNCPPEAYEEGFLEGYADYLLRGGNCAPPAVPPVSYRRKRNLDVEGHLEIRSYYAGFANGAALARASGLRVFFTIPISTPLPPPQRKGYDAATAATTIPASTMTAPTAEPLPLPVEVLPLPRKTADIEPMPLPQQSPKAGPLQPGEQSPRSESLPRPAPLARLQTLPEPPTPETDRVSMPEPETESPAAAIAETPLPREFTVPILGGPASR